MYSTIFTVIEKYDKVNFVNTETHTVSHICPHKQRKFQSQWFLNETIDKPLLKPKLIPLNEDLIFQGRAVKGGICRYCEEVFVIYEHIF